jgi:hypothetical protein
VLTGFKWLRIGNDEALFLFEKDNESSCSKYAENLMTS